jgi:hypothetical protein
MARTRQVVRKVERRLLSDFDEQLWPINCMLVILAGFVAGLIFVFSRFDDPRPLHNAYTQLAAVVVTVAALIVGTAKYGSRIRNRRMQLAVLIALFIYMWLIILLSTVLVRWSYREPPPDQWIAEEQPVRLPDLGRSRTHVHDSALRPLETPAVEPTPSEVPRQDAATPPVPTRVPRQEEPAATVRDATVAQLERRQMSVPRAGQSPAAASISRSEPSQQALPNQTAAQPQVAAERSTAAALQPATPSVARQASSNPQATRRTDAELPPQTTVQPSPAAAMARRDSAQQATPQPTQATVARSATDRPTAVDPAAAAAQPAAVADAGQASAAQPTLATSRSETNLAQVARPAVAEPQAAATPQVGQAPSWPQRTATPAPQPQAVAAVGSPASRSSAATSLPSSPAATAGAVAQAVAEASTAQQQPAAGAAAQRTATASAAVAAEQAGSTLGADSVAVHVGSAPAQRAGQAAAPQLVAQSATPGSAARSATAANLPGSAADVPAAGAVAGQATPASAAPQPAAAGMARTSPAAAATAAAAGSGAALPAAPTSIAAAGGGPSRTAPAPAVGPASAGASSAAGLQRASSGTPLAGAATAADVPSVPGTVAASGQGAAPQVASAAAGAQRTSGATGPVVTAPGGAGEPGGGSSPATITGPSVARGSGGGSQGQPSLNPGAAAGSVGRTATGVALAAPSAVDPGGNPTAVAAAGTSGTDPAGPAGAQVQRSGSDHGLDGIAKGNADFPAGDTPMAVAAGGAPARAEGSGPQVAVGTGAAGQLPQRTGGPARLMASAAAELPTSLGGEGDAAGPNALQGPSAGGTLRREADVSGLAARGDTDEPVGQPTPEVALAGGGRPSRADGGTAEGPQLAQLGGPAPRRTAAVGLPGGADLADDPGPLPGELVASGDTSAGAGPAAVSAPRMAANALEVQISAQLGPGGTVIDRPAIAGTPSRQARPDSDVVQLEPRRLPLARVTSGLAIDAAVRDEPVPAFEQRSPSDRAEVARQRGGDTASEAAVEAGLDFLARHQSPDGRWSLHAFAQGRNYGPAAGEAIMQADTAATGLALLAFLGAGYTHESGKYRDTVSAGLAHLIAEQKPDGDLFSGGSRYVWLYSHGIAAIALCEAYAMTRDPQLRGPAQRAIDFIVAAQDRQDGAWRYAPGIGSDTSVAGWQLMALKSGELAGLHVPHETYQRLQGWLQGAQAKDGTGRFIYRPNSQIAGQRQPNNAMTAEGALMMLYLDWDPAHPEARRTADYLMQHLPSFGAPGRITRDAYYWYYGTLVMFHMGGSHWSAWNSRMLPLLKDSQVKQGPLAGSWNPAGELPDRWGREAGRIYVTAMHLLILEVYYRHLPLLKTADAVPAG